MPGTWVPLDMETERCVSEVVDSGIAIHRELGPGFGEPVYHNAFCLELESRGISFECEKSIVVRYRNSPVGIHRLDLVVAKRVVVEIKAVKGLAEVHEAQILSYLRASGLRVGLLMNFGEPTLRQGLRRFVR
jgi:GxxExxY protein